jgi:hypothetical protein
MMTRDALAAIDDAELRRSLYLVRGTADLLRKLSGDATKAYIEARELELELTCELGRRTIASANKDL